jgi:hypothetical protein
VLRQRWESLGERPWLGAIGASPWLLPVAIAVGAHALWLSGSTVAERPRRPLPTVRAADNTPELLRFSSRASQAASPAAGLGTLTLPFESSLPPPPPELAGAPLPPPPPAMAGQGQGRARPTSPVLAAARGGAKSALAWGVEPVTARGIPADAATSLELAGQLDAPPTDSTAQSGQQDPTAKPEDTAKGEGSKPALAALARRHLRLTAANDRPYRILWDSGSAAGSRPDSLAGLPEGVEVRRLPLAAARAMGLAQPHGITVKSPAGLLLLWVQGDDLWLIRQAPAAASSSTRGLLSPVAGGYFSSGSGIANRATAPGPGSGPPR